MHFLTQKALNNRKLTITAESFKAMEVWCMDVKPGMRREHLTQFRQRLIAATTLKTSISIFQRHGGDPVNLGQPVDKGAAYSYKLINILHDE